jgi:hypothetical protein
MKIATVALPAIALLVCAAASAQTDAPAPPNPDTRSLPQITIQAQRDQLQKRVYDFVRGATRTDYDESLKRWDVPVCFLVAGFPRDQGEFVLSRLSQIATSAGVPLAADHCRPNFSVVVSPEPDRLLQQWRQNYSVDMFGAGTAPGEIKAFISKYRPVRVWYNTTFVSNQGEPVPPERSAFTNPDGFAALNRRADATRLSRNDLVSFFSATVIVDGNRMTGLTIGQLADYIAMVGMTAVNLDTDRGDAPTILRLFGTSQQPLPSGLTEWDQALLKALYSSDQSSSLQRSNIALRVAHDVAH